MARPMTITAAVRPRRRRGAALLLLVALGWALLAAGPASAHHADLVRSEPSQGARVAVPGPVESGSPGPIEVRGWFNLPLIVPGSGLAVTDARGQRVDDREQRRVGGDLHSLAVELPDPAPGAYTVTWRVMAESDFDYAQGSFGFEVVAARQGWAGREGLLALGLGLLTFGVMRAARPTADL